jgi:predicted PurR-regulated permease PerM
MQIRNLLNPDTHLRIAYRGFAAIMFILLAVPLVTRVLPVLGPLLVGGVIAYVLYRRSVG